MATVVFSPGAFWALFYREFVSRAPHLIQQHGARAFPKVSLAPCLGNTPVEMQGTPSQEEASWRLSFPVPLTFLGEITDGQLGYEDSNFHTHLIPICSKNNPVYISKVTLTCCPQSALIKYLDEAEKCDCSPFSHENRNKEILSDLTSVISSISSRNMNRKQTNH